MTKRPRPFIPLDVRIQVARRQLSYFVDPLPERAYLTRKQYLGALLGLLGDYITTGEPLELDHYPALILRPFNERTGKYIPDANEPDALVYRPKGEHDEKSFGRKQGASRTVTTKGSDIWLKAKFNRLEKPRKQRRKIPSRPFPGRQK